MTMELEQEGGKRPHFTGHLGYCRCCHTQICREYRFNGVTYVPEYYDDGVLQAAGAIEAYKITNCPGCGEWLTEEIVANNTRCRIERPQLQQPVAKAEREESIPRRTDSRRPNSTARKLTRSARRGSG
jgi:hypothetical protein